MTTAILFGLISAITWGAGDFSGGMAVKRSNPYGVVISAHVVSLTLLSLLATIIGEPVPPLRDWLWGAAAGLGGGMGLAMLYSALASGQMSVAAPVSALVAAALPVLVGVVSEGIPGWGTMAGFGLALAAVWLVSGGTGVDFHFGPLRLPLLAGLSFGAFFIFLHEGSSLSVLWPTAATRIASIISLSIFSAATHQPWIPKRESLLPILASSILDTAGNVFYALSARSGRMDVAAVLGSLYPGSTVILAWFVLKERITRWQMVGILVALVAIVLITI